jgi:hypothetical protein
MNMSTTKSTMAGDTMLQQEARSSSSFSSCTCVRSSSSSAHHHLRFGPLTPQKKGGKEKKETIRTSRGFDPGKNHQHRVHNAAQCQQISFVIYIYIYIILKINWRSTRIGGGVTRGQCRH